VAATGAEAVAGQQRSPARMGSSTRRDQEKLKKGINKITEGIIDSQPLIK